MSRAFSTPDRAVTPADGADILVVGGGIVGMACALRLQDAGREPAVFDAGAPEERATWAAGGMLAPLGEAREPGPFLDLALESLALYPDFVAGLEAGSGVSVGLHLNGKILAALDAGGEERLREREAWIREDGHRVRWLHGPDLHRLEPGVAPGARGGLLLEGNGRVDNRRLQEALEVAARRRRIPVVRGRVTGLITAGGRVRGVRLEDGSTVNAGTVVVAAGAWSGRLAGLGEALPVRPVKGQMLAFDAPGRPLARVVTSPRVYLIPRDTPRGPVVVAGATEEEAGFDTTVTAPAQRALEEGARELVPALARAPVVERWCGLRPGTPDGLPLIGPHPEVEGVIVATGHYRNGILLAPATARAVEAAAAGRDEERYAAFRPGRRAACSA